MNDLHISAIATELNLKKLQIQAVSTLLDDGATVPFIARYRKEATGSLDEVKIASIRDRLNQLEELDKRKNSILKSLQQQGRLTDELQKKVLNAPTLVVLEDIYLPYRPKRRTKATIARDKGLEPLAQLIFTQNGIDPYQSAESYFDPAKEVNSVEDALSGARDIIAEMINEDPQARAELRNLFTVKGLIRSRVATDVEAKGTKYKDYFDWIESAASAPSHRILAIRRGEREDILNLNIAPPEEEAIQVLEDFFLKEGDGQDSKQVKIAIKDSYKRLLSRSMETELRLTIKQRADSEAIRVFAANLRELLIAPPLGPKKIMGIDPGFRTGCKLVCVDRQGKLLHYDTLFLHLNEKNNIKAGEVVLKLCDRYEIEAIAVGNGTAGRETETFVKNLSFSRDIPVFLVNESGASIYSASEVAREEFPDLDLTVRGAVSIARRLMDPLSELVKIDPKSIGVGQYQHDVDQTDLKKSLDDIVISCVNGVGVDLNRASVQLLTYVSGLGTQLAKNILAYRNENGPFRNRKELLNIQRLGPKVFEQSAGFLRIRDGENPLDASAVHPESYCIVDAMANDLNCSIKDLMSIPTLREKINICKYVTDTTGLPTLKDILSELAKPGRDPREAFELFSFSDDIKKMEDLKPGMRLPGIVTNVTAFGAFVDIGVHQDGLVHISELSDTYVKEPTDFVKVQQKVMVKVIEVDLLRNRISLSMKTAPGKSNQHQKNPTKQKTKAIRSKAKNKPFNNPFTDLFK